MLDSNSKHPENRIHLYDIVGLLNDGYGGFKPSNHTFKPRRQALSYDHDPNLGLRSYDSTASLRSYDSFEVDSFAIASSASFNETFTFETSNGANSHENGGSNTITNTSTIIEDRNDGGLRFLVVDSIVEDDDQSSDPSTPKLWRSTSSSFPSKSVDFPAANPLNCNQQGLEVERKLNSDFG